MICFVQHIAAAFSKPAERFFPVGNDQEIQPVKVSLAFFAAKIIRVALQFQALAALPVDQSVCPPAQRGARGLRISRNRGQVGGGKLARGQRQPEKRRQFPRRKPGDTQPDSRALVSRCERNGPIQSPGSRGQRFLFGELIRKDSIRGGERFAIRPQRVWPQPEFHAGLVHLELTAFPFLGTVAGRAASRAHQDACLEHAQFAIRIHNHIPGLHRDGDQADAAVFQAGVSVQDGFEYAPSPSASNGPSYNAANTVAFEPPVCPS